MINETLLSAFVGEVRSVDELRERIEWVAAESLILRTDTLMRRMYESECGLDESVRCWEQVRAALEVAHRALDRASRIAFKWDVVRDCDCTQWSLDDLGRCENCGRRHA